MLDIAPEFAQEAEAITIRKAVERGHFRDAHTLAQRSRMRSIHYQQCIDDRLFQARRAADRIVWSEDVLPELDDARTHLRDRRKHEAAIIDSIREHIPNARDDTRDHLVDIMRTMEDCHERHAAPFGRVMTASEEFRRLQVHAFEARRNQNVPDLEDRILVPLLAAPMSVTSGMSHEIGIVFAVPSPPLRYDLALLFASCTRPRFRRDPVAVDDADDLVRLQRLTRTRPAGKLRSATARRTGRCDCQSRCRLNIPGAKPRVCCTGGLTGGPFSTFRSIDDKGVWPRHCECRCYLQLREVVHDHYIGRFAHGIGSTRTSLCNEGRPA